MRQILVPLLLLSTFAYSSAQSYTLGPDSLPHDGVPKGTVTKFVLPPGKSYPGTPHNCALYVPAQYDGAKPTPFMIFLDGSQALNALHVPTVLDNLIAKRDLPPMIAVFVDPGILPAVSDQDQSRYNRIYEYDSLTPLFSEFLLNELIPEVRKNYNLSQNPDDRGLSGVSTGAVGAFAAAWNRPDQFHRVLSLIGTYVSMKGADELPGLIRKTEPKPIRIFMQDGSHDHITAAEPYGTHFSGSWPINNEVTYEALEFAGYDVKFEMGTGGHDLDQGGAILPDALRWLWRGYPAPIVEQEPAAAHEPGYDANDRVFSTIYVDKPWQQIGSQYGYLRSLTSDDIGNVYFSDPSKGGVNRIDTDGNVTKFTEFVAGTAILRMGPDARLYAYQRLAGGGNLVSFNTANAKATDRKIVADGILSGDDFVITQKGTIYLLGGLRLSRIGASGKLETALDAQHLFGNMRSPTGLALSPDQSMLVVVDWMSRYSLSLQIAADGSVGNGEPFYRVEMPETTESSTPNGVRGGAVEDTNGQVYFATPLGIQIAMQNGRISQILNSPITGGRPLTAITFAPIGDQSWLYVAQDGKLFRRPVKVKGANAWTVVKPPKPTL